MASSVHACLRRRWPLLLLTGTLVGGGTVVTLRLVGQVERELPGFLHARLEAALGRKIELGRVHVLPTGVWVEHVRVPRISGEAADPLSARGLDVAVDWWSLVMTRRLHVPAVLLDRAKVRLGGGPAGKPPKPWTAQLARLSRSGVAQLGLRHSSVEWLPTAGKGGWTAGGIDARLRLDGANYGYQGRIGRFDAPGLTLASLELSGRGNSERVTIAKGLAAYQGGRLEASGTLAAVTNQVNVELRAQRIPLSRIARELGIPDRWAVKGHVTGTLTVDARAGALRSVRGLLELDRGSVNGGGGELPWQSARAQVDWTPDHAEFRDLRLTGRDLTLVAEGSVETPGGTPFTSGHFRTSGKLRAQRGGAVRQVASLLAFDPIMGGRWDASGATVDFQAHGPVADVSRARATGKLHVEQLRFRPQSQGEVIRVAGLDALIERTDDRLAVREVEAHTDGLSLALSGSLTDDAPGRPAGFQVEGRVEVADLQSLQAAVPQSTLWRWIPADSPQAAGRLSFHAGGPLAHPEQLWSDGTFEARDLRLAAAAPAPGQPPLTVPVTLAHGEFHHSDGKLAVRQLGIQSPAFHGDGELTLAFDGPDPADPQVELALHLLSEDWRALPAVPADVLPELQGGRLDGSLRLAGRYSTLGQAPVDGSLRLVDAQYTPGRPGATAVPVRELAARFRWADRTLDLPEVTVDTPVVAGTAHGQVLPSGEEYRLAVEVDATAPDAGGLVARFAPDARVEGGLAHLVAHAEAPLARLKEGSLDGKLSVKEARLARAVPMLPGTSHEVTELALDFAGSAAGWQVRRATLAAPGLQASLTGTVTGSVLDGTLELVTDRWAAPEDSPVTGGRVQLAGRLRGDHHKSDTLRFGGEAELTGAALRYARKGAELRGGLRVSARGEGLVQDLRHWLSDGQVELSGATVALKDQPVRRLDALSGKIAREGEGFRLTEGRLALDGATATAEGLWTPAGHELTLSAETPSLDQLKLKLPQGVHAGRARAAFVLRGDEKEPVRQADGHVEVDGGRMTVADRVQSLDHVAAKLHYTPAGVRVEKLEGRGPAGTLLASGSWSRTGHEFTGSLAGDDFSRLGISLPQGFRLGGFRVGGRLAGNPKQPLASGEGTIAIDGAQFPFGPNSPHRLDTAGAHFRLEGDHVLLTGIQGQGPAGRATGEAEITGRRFRLALDCAEVNPSVARWLVPGQITGGRLSGSLAMQVNLDHPAEQSAVRLATGRFQLLDARYVLPETLALAATPARIDRAAGDFRWEAGKTVVSKLEIASKLLTAQGSVIAREGKVQVQARLTSDAAGRVSDYWPQLAGRYSGGIATGTLDARYDETGLRGTLDVASRGGLFLLPGAPAEYGEQPVDTASMTLAFAPGRLVFSDVKVRGPKANADGSGTWVAGGSVFGQGKAWFSKAYTATMIRPSGWGWLAKLVGVREIKTDFTLGGTSDRVTLNAGITRSMLWKFAKGAVPKEFQAVAAGKSPLWVRPLEVAEAPVPKPTPGGSEE